VRAGSTPAPSTGSCLRTSRRSNTKAGNTRSTAQRTIATSPHEAVELADGFVQGTIIECPMHNGRFDFTTGEAKGAPACINLLTYPVKVEGGRLFIRLN
jgi:Rieske Fe-S protein